MSVSSLIPQDRDQRSNPCAKTVHPRHLLFSIKATVCVLSKEQQNQQENEKTSNIITSIRSASPVHGSPPHLRLRTSDDSLVASADWFTQVQVFPLRGAITETSFQPRELLLIV